MIITISGNAGSGKSTVAKEIAKKLGYNFYCVGDLRGKMATERGMTIDQLNKLGEKEAWTDNLADEYQADLAKKEDNFIVDSRLGFHFIPAALKIFLKVHPNESARRVFINQRPDEERKESIEEVKQMLTARDENDRQRYMKYYNVDHLDLSHYDLVIDTTNLKLEQLQEKIFNYLRKKGMNC